MYLLLFPETFEYKSKITKKTNYWEEILPVVFQQYYDTLLFAAQQGAVKEQ